MPTNVETTREFDKETERLGRKYPAVFDEIEGLISQIESDIRPGSRVAGVGATVYKARLPNPSSRRGKSGGFRLIYYVQQPDTVFLITIYSKTEKDDISATAIRRILNSIP